MGYVREFARQIWGIYSANSENTFPTGTPGLGKARTSRCVPVCWLRDFPSLKRCLICLQVWFPISELETARPARRMPADRREGLDEPFQRSR